MDYQFVLPVLDINRTALFPLKEAISLNKKDIHKIVFTPALQSRTKGLTELHIKTFDPEKLQIQTSPKIKRKLTPLRKRAQKKHRPILDDEPFSPSHQQQSAKSENEVKRVQQSVLNGERGSVQRLLPFKSPLKYEGSNKIPRIRLLKRQQIEDGYILQHAFDDIQEEDSSDAYKKSFKYELRKRLYREYSVKNVINSAREQVKEEEIPMARSPDVFLTSMSIEEDNSYATEKLLKFSKSTSLLRQRPNELSIINELDQVMDSCREFNLTEEKNKKILKSENQMLKDKFKAVRIIAGDSDVQFKPGYIKQNIRDFKESKPGFIYGPKFQGRFIQVGAKYR